MAEIALVPVCLSAAVRFIRAHQAWMLARTPLVEAEQNGSIRIQDLTKVVMAGGVSGWPKSDWYNLKLPGTLLTPMIVHVRFIAFSLSA